MGGDPRCLSRHSPALGGRLSPRHPARFPLSARSLPAMGFLIAVVHLESNQHLQLAKTGCPQDEFSALQATAISK